jgi:hypothetical protein
MKWQSMNIYYSVKGVCELKLVAEVDVPTTRWLSRVVGTSTSATNFNSQTPLTNRSDYDYATVL